MKRIEITHELVREVLVALRGARSQEELSRKLGYSFNQVYRWESGQKRVLWPDFVAICKAVKAPLKAAMGPLTVIEEGYDRAPAIVARLKGPRKVQHLAAELGVPRTTVSRWLSGKTEPPLPDMFKLMEHGTLAFLEFLAALVTIEELPSLKCLHQERMRARNAHYELPYLGGVKPCLGLRGYLELAAHQEGYIANALKISLEEERAALKLLEDIGEIKWNGTKYEAQQTRLDTRGTREGFSKLNRYWTSRAFGAIDACERGGQKSLIGYRVYSISEEGYQKIREAHIGFYNSLTAIIAADDKPREFIMTLNLHNYLPSEDPGMTTVSIAKSDKAQSNTD